MVSLTRAHPNQLPPPSWLLDASRVPPILHNVSLWAYFQIVLNEICPPTCLHQPLWFKTGGSLHTGKWSGSDRATFTCWSADFPNPTNFSLTVCIHLKKKEGPKHGSLASVHWWCLLWLHEVGRMVPHILFFFFPSLFSFFNQSTNWSEREFKFLGRGATTTIGQYSLSFQICWQFFHGSNWCLSLQFAPSNTLLGDWLSSIHPHLHLHMTTCNSSWNP